ncbi:SCO2322 family protein [Streptomyces ficellus]|uniref:SCO2322 family protein n=1 Tax=Streptomyces ficellus TaxID=1977088 RepID=A0ABT7ZEE5_9ACTN|nr:SCO2322 family protein [Streptomyces ficellus]MDN3297864.1 SCO2322 family protein [Streptomyces ficellus]
MRRAVRSLPLVLIAAVLSVFAAGHAQAAGYRYWSFWESGTGGGEGAEWTYATQGPATARPSDGDVNGFRFAVSTDAADSVDAARPRRAPDFAAICGAAPAEDGTKRVGVVIDFGTAADAPDGSGTPPEARVACARVPEDATSAEALAAVAKPLRYNSQALLCAIAGYPRSGCGERVADAEPTPTADAGRSAEGSGPSTGESGGSAEESGRPSADESGPSIGVVGGLAAVAVLGAAAVWQARSRRR